jgi:hypothetical protein
MTRLREKEKFILFARKPVAPVTKTVFPSRNCIMLPNSIGNRNRKIQCEMFSSME